VLVLETHATLLAACSPLCTRYVLSHYLLRPPLPPAQVLDARDPAGCRCPDVERYVRSLDPNKRIILLLNKMGELLFFYTWRGGGRPPAGRTLGGGECCLCGVVSFWGELYCFASLCCASAFRPHPTSPAHKLITNLLCLFFFEFKPCHKTPVQTLCRGRLGRLG
jgi:hypothetical protein